MPGFEAQHLGAERAAGSGGMGRGHGAGRVEETRAWWMDGEGAKLVCTYRGQSYKRV